MSAESNRKLKHFVTLFRETWAECEAFREKQRIEASGIKPNWQHCLRTAHAQAEELFKPLFSAIRKNEPLVPLLDGVRESLEVSRNKDRFRRSTRK